jgi:LysM repeat protein
MLAKSARFLAPLVLLAVAAGTYVIVHSGLATHTHTTVHSSTVLSGRGLAPRRRVLRAKYYVVKSGDTLSAISVKTRVPIQKILNLNPSVSANSLQTGLRLRLRR